MIIMMTLYFKGIQLEKKVKIQKQNKTNKQTIK